MKIAKQDNPTNIDNLFEGTEPADKKDQRIHYIVDDAYDFATNNATDVSSIENWDKFSSKRDFKFIRLEIIKMYIAKGVDEAARWAACSEAEKDIVCKYLVAGGVNRVTRVGADQDKANYKAFGRKMIASRDARIEEALLEIGYMLGVQENIEDMFSELRDKIEDHKKLNSKDLKEWINNEGAYASAGFQQKAYYNSNIRDKFNDIVENGNY